MVSRHSGRPDAEWRWQLDFPTEALASEARAADLLVIGKVKTSHVPYGLLAPGKLVLNAGRPRAVRPRRGRDTRCRPRRHRLEDTREARRAVVDALPLLRKAARVSIVEFHREKVHFAPADVNDLIRYLARHRIAAEPHGIRHREGSDADDLIQFALRQKANLLVMGDTGTAGSANEE